jgi:hypothetical protein
LQLFDLRVKSGKRETVSCQQNPLDLSMGRLREKQFIDNGLAGMLRQKYVHGKKKAILHFLNRD